MMMKLCTMASHGYPHGLGVVIVPEQGSNRLSKDIHHLLPYHGSNQDVVNSHSLNHMPMHKEDWKSTSGYLDYDQFVSIDSTSYKSAAFTDVQDTHPDSELLSFGYAERFTRKERILKLLASGSIEEEAVLLDPSLLYDFMGPRSLMADLSQLPLASCSRWYSNDPQPLVYPTRKFYFNEPLRDLEGDLSDLTENTHHTNSQVQFNCIETEMHDVLSVFSCLHMSKNAIKSSKQTLLVPYFERRRRARANTDVLKLATEKVGSLKSHEKVKKASQKKNRGRDIYCNSYLHACGSLLSIAFYQNRQGQNTILSLRKSGSQLPQLLIQFSASIAGTGIALLLSVLCKVACTRVPFCASKLWSTGLGLGLVWLSWGVNKLGNTVISISKTAGNEKEDQMMNHLDSNLKDIYFRVAALMAVAVLRLA